MWTKKIDKSELILKTLYNYVKESNKLTIRRSELKNLCETNLNKATNGAQQSLGGTFQRSLKMMEENRFIKCISKQKKFTEIIINISKIECYFEEEHLQEYLSRQKEKRRGNIFEEINLDEIIHEIVGIICDKIIALNPNLLKERNILYLSYKILKNTMSQFLSHIILRSLEIHFSSSEVAKFFMEKKQLKNYSTQL